MKVMVYFNLHKNIWSIKALEGERKNRVIGHASVVIIDNAIGKVQEGGRLRTVREQKKYVHAGIVGSLSHTDNEALRPYCQSDLDVECRLKDKTVSRNITYNPYKHEHFVYRDNENEKFESCIQALLVSGPNGERNVLVTEEI